MTTALDHEVVIVGAGFGGMGAAIQLKRMGVDDLVILEREDDLGGTWHVNRYPGLAVDIPSAMYSYSFEPNPYWSRLFAPGAELKDYADYVAEKYDLRRHMRFDTVVDGAQWGADEQHWVVAAAGGETLTARYLITATGFLSQPRTPDIPGIETFTGKVIHTARWDDSVDLTGRKAALIGTGATAVQLVPKVAQEVAELTVYQRTPIWVAPKVDGPVPRAVQALFARVPLTQWLARQATNAAHELLIDGGVLHFRQARVLNQAAAGLARLNLRRQVGDPKLRRKLTPDYDFGCKRPTFSNAYFRTFTRPHVHLETSPIARVEADGIVTEDGDKAEIDTLILATGFSLWDTNFPAIEVVGRAGRNLGKWWRVHRFQAYQGITVPHFPNFLSLNSPYSWSSSYFITIESQMKHIKRLIGEVRRRDAATFEVTEAANEKFLNRVTEALGDSVFALGQCATARSYYFNPHGEAALLRPTSGVNAAWEAGHFPLEDYTYA